jgi:hypothetical protein
MIYLFNKTNSEQQTLGMTTVEKEGKAFRKLASPSVATDNKRVAILSEDLSLLHENIKSVLRTFCPLNFGSMAFFVT